MAHGKHAQDGRTALIHSVANGRTDCVRLLLDAGANTEAKGAVRLSIFSVTVVIVYNVPRS